METDVAGALSIFHRIILFVAPNVAHHCTIFVTRRHD